MSVVDQSGADRTKGWSADQGSGTVMVIGVVALAMVLACAGIVCAVFLVSLNRAQDIADLSAWQARTFLRLLSGRTLRTKRAK